MHRQLSLCTSAEYRIVLQGILSESWHERFDSLQLTLHQETGCTELRGIVRDQSQLIGILRRINGLAMPIISVQCLSVTRPSRVTESLT